MSDGSRLALDGRTGDGTVQRALDAIRVRKRCEATFGRELAGSPAWPLLLELFVHRAAGLDAEEELLVSPGTPRYRRMLEGRGLIEAGAARGTLTLTAHGYRAVGAVLAS